MKLKEMVPGIVVALLIVAVCVCPLPRRVDAALEGVRLSDGAAEETVEIELHGWYLTYLLHTNELKAKVTVTPCALEGEEALTAQFTALVFSHDGINRAVLDR